MKTISVLCWLVFFGVTLFQTIKYIRLRRRVNYIHSKGAVLTNDDRNYFNEMSNATAIVIAIFTLTTIVDTLICVF